MTIYSIQYLRGIAALLVVIHHMCLIAQLDFLIGAVGVDIFFVISGFIMWIVTQEREVTRIDFLKHRLVRIVPLYWLMTFLLLGATLVKPQFFTDEIFSVKHMLNSLFFVPHYGPTGKMRPFLGQGWTLNYEMFFYALFALTLVAQRRIQLIALTSLLLVLAATGLVVQPSNAVLKTYTSPLLLEFLAGIWLGWLWTKGKMPSPAVGGLLVAGAVAALVAVYLLDAEETGIRAIVLGIPAAAVVAGSLAIEARHGIKRIGAAKILGDASYSIYLAHMFAWPVTAVLAAKLGFADALALQAAIAIAMGIAGGIACYFAVERLMMRYLRRRI